MPLATIQIMLLTFAGVSLITLIILTAINLYRKDEIKNQKISTAARMITALFIIASILFIATTMLARTALAHGAYEFNDVTVAQTIEHVRKSPVDQSQDLPENPKNMVVYMYRYTCPDCEDVHDYMTSWLDKQPIPHLYVSSRSEKGSKLRDSAHVEEVPSMLYFDKDGKVTTLVVYKMDTNEKVAVPDTDALDKIERLIQNDN